MIVKFVNKGLFYYKKSIYSKLHKNEQPELVKISKPKKDSQKHLDKSKTLNYYLGHRINVLLIR